MIFIYGCNGCTVRLLMASSMAISAIQFVGKAGKVIRDSSIGYLTEKAIDELVAWIDGEESSSETEETATGIEVIPFSNNSLKGYAKNNYSIRIKGKREDRESSTSVNIKANELIFERLNLSSGWQLTMSTQQLVNEYFKNGCAQLSLRDLGYNPQGVDGKIGKNSRKAIRAFQKDFGLSPTGNLDKETMTALLGDGFLVNN